MNTTCAVLTFLILMTGVVRADGAKDPTKPPETQGTSEIDFSPLPTMAAGRYELRVKARAGKDTYDQTFDMDGRTSHLGTRDLIKASFESAGWRIAVNGDSKLLVYGSKDSALGPLEVRVEGLPKHATPSVRRFAKE